MRKVIVFFLLCVFMLDTPLLFAQYAPQPQETYNSGQTQILTGTLTKFGNTRIWIVIRRGGRNSTYYFRIDQETVIEGTLGLGKTISVEYKFMAVKGVHRIVKYRTAVKITVLP